jgi:uncharacterized alpha-E superfamily protein
MQQPMLSRVADSLYWMSRYLERTEHLARLLDVHMNLMLDTPAGAIEIQRVQRLRDSLSLKETEGESASADDLVYMLTFHAGMASSISSTMTVARENARQVREQISSEMWMQINRLYLHVRQVQKATWQAAPHDFYMQVKEGSHLFQGITDATMNHNQGWYFIQLGRYIERAINLLGLLEAHLSDPDLQEQDAVSANRYFELVASLKSVSAFEAYCKVYNPNVQSLRICEFLLFNDEFPRSLRFCVDMIVQALQALADDTLRNRNTRLYRIAGKLQSSLSYDDMTDVRTQSLHRYVESIKQQVVQIHDTLYDTYITYPIEAAL